MSSHQIQSLLQLLDDPNEEIFFLIAPQITQAGMEVLPYINELYDQTIDDVVISRLNTLSANIQANALAAHFSSLLQEKELSFIEIILSLHPICPLGKERTDATNFIQMLRKKVWLECNQYLTTLEQVQVMIKILFQHLQLKDAAYAAIQPTYHHLFIGSLMNAQHGHNILLAMLYKGLGQLFEIPISLVQLKEQKILCAFHLQNGQQTNDILCYLDPGFGTVYAAEDLPKAHLISLAPKEILHFYFEELYHLATTYNQDFLSQFSQQMMGHYSKD